MLSFKEGNCRMNKSNGKRRIQIDLPAWIIQALEEEAEAQKRRLKNQVEHLIEQYVIGKGHSVEGKVA
jgi:hypothetical protein